MVIWIVTVLLSVISLFVLLVNPIGVIQAIRAGKNYSSVALVGGVTGCIACLISPIESMHRFWWVPLVADFSILGIASLPVFLLLRAIRDRRRDESGDE